MNTKRDKIMDWLKQMSKEDKILLVECLIESEKPKNKYSRINIFNAEPEIIEYDTKKDWDKNCMFVYGHTKPYDYIEEMALNETLEDFARDKANQY